MARQDYLGSGRSFEEKDGSLLQDLVAKGYKNCVRRTYFLRLVPKPDSNVGPTLPRDESLIRRGALQTLSAAKFSERWRLLQQALLELCRPPQSEWFASADVGFSLDGLQKLGVREPLLEVFKRKSPAFDEGAHARAHRHLLDTGESDPTTWSTAYKGSESTQAFNVVIFMHVAAVRMHRPFSAPTKLLIEAERALINCLTDTKCELHAPLLGDWVETAAPLDDRGHEHFGYRDGITQPSYRAYAEIATPPTPVGTRDVHALGEVLLGHQRNEGDNPYADLGLTPRRHSRWEPSYAPHDDSAKNFFLNSSFGVLRRMEQRSQVFEAWIAQQAAKHFPPDSADGLTSRQSINDPYTLRKAWIKAKLLGRTSQGVRLTPRMTWADFDAADRRPSEVVDQKSQMPAPPVIGREGGFHHRDADGRPTANDDSQGAGCPFSSHIRRMNPQDDPVSPFIHRPLLRRGLPYTDVFANEQKMEVGLAGLFICADLVEQFEHLVGVWAQHRVMGVPESSPCRDPLIGSHGDAPPKNALALTTPDGRVIELPLTQNFVVTRGCAYLWFPSKHTLSQLDRYT